MNEDERWITVDGRRWRASDPSIPPKLRKELVDELMAARRAVSAANRSGNAEDLAGARRRVHSAKIALGERGKPWWQEMSDHDLRPRVEAVIEVLTRHRFPDRSICPSDAARAVGGPSWRRRMDLVRQVGTDMADRGLIEITQRGTPVEGSSWRGPIRFRATEVDDDGGVR